MALKAYSPVTPGRRGMTSEDFSEVTENKPEKSLLGTLNRSGGRNSHGKITSRHRGGGHKRRYRFIDFKRNKDDVAATVKTIEYDPNRSVRIALVEYEDGEKRYVLAAQGIRVGDTLENGPDAEPKPGNCMPLGRIPLGLMVHNIELQPGRGGKIARSAGGYALLTAREGNYVHLTLPSGEIRRVLGICRATVGRLGNVDHSKVNVGKAGRNRHKGRRPKVRGKAMNPVDHPLGGGEGRSNGGRHPCSPTGVLAKGGKTRKRNKHSDRLIVRRRR